jgi:predicted RNA-binding protein YlxR (DUF448 family)
MPKPKHVPQRMCVVCKERDPKRSLMRFVRTLEGVYADPTGKAEGRGAYLCSAPECRLRAVTSEVLAKALRTSLNDADRERIRQTL